MIDPKKIEDMAKQIGALIPSQLRQAADDIEGKIKLILQQKLAQLDVISRDEFDVQRQVLARTREKVDLLETQVQALLAERTTPSTKDELPSSDQQ
ncbi:accessory factor UbiK family protein [Alkalimonas collagenimarina]|uniref:Ubiquinone biosynthesis accessory factor UbiK n=1 Tax=Alkalimonas collagenimarina TaxID=400390 RepID=A0ABT9GY51_9GAMM|nr:accessory factor UbiK family protein [Alkalimonas collagenimarina]MDP4535982.1 accessory factor UbiK family protein [Alkalimonas collagenimarina]